VDFDVPGAHISPKKKRKREILEKRGKPSTQPKDLKEKMQRHPERGGGRCPFDLQEEVAVSMWEGVFAGGKREKAKRL